MSFLKKAKLNWLHVKLFKIDQPVIDGVSGSYCHHTRREASCIIGFTGVLQCHRGLPAS